MLLENTTTTDLAEVCDDIEVAVFPVGSTEQHGPALPLSTDSQSAESVAAGVSDRDDVVVLPTLPIGVSPHHRQFHGSLWVTEETFESFVRETLESITAHGVEKAIIVNGHGGNVTSIERVSQDLYRDEIAFTVPWSWWEGVGDTPQEVLDDDVEVPGHAAGFEGSMMLHLAAELVREKRFEEAAKGVGDGSRFDHPAVRGYDFADWTDNGVHGDPRLADADAGEALQQASVTALEDLIDWLTDLPSETCRPRPHK